MNIQQMMKQAQQMQRKIQENQEKFEKMEFTGTAGNNAVSITIMGTGMVKSISIDDALFVKEEKDMLEDLLIVAFNDARKKADKESADSMNNATGGINLKNMKLPF